MDEKQMVIIPEIHFPVGSMSCHVVYFLMSGFGFGWSEYGLVLR